MADGTIEIDVKVNAGDIGSEVEGKAKAAGKAAGDDIEKGVEQGGAKGGKAAGREIADEVEKGAKDGAESAEKSLGGIGSGLKGAAIGGVIAAGVGAATAALSGLAAEAAETQKFMSRLEASAEQNGISAEYMEAAYTDLVGVIGETDRAVETANNAFALCGESQEELEGFTKSLTGAYALFGDSLPIEGLAEAANETAKVGTVTGSFADALNWANVSQEQWNAALQEHPAAMEAFTAALDGGMSAEDAFNEALAACTTEQERQQLVLSTLNALYGEAGAKYQEANADLIAYNESQDRFKQALSEIGEALMPAATGVTDFASSILETLAPALETGTQKLGEFVNNVAENITPVLQSIWDNIAPDAEGFFLTVQEAVGKIQQAFTDLGEQLAPIIGELKPIFEDFAGIVYDIGSKIAEVFGEIIPPILEAVAPIIKDAMFNMVRDLKGGLNKFDEAWQEFKPTLDEFVEWFTVNVIGAFEQAWPYVEGFVSTLSSIGDTINNTVWPALQTLWEFLNTYIFPVLEYFGNKFEEKFAIVGWVVDQAKQKIEEFVSNVKKFFTEDVPYAIDTMGQFFQDIPNKVRQALTDAINAIIQFAQDCANRARQAGQDFLNGIQDGFNRAVDFVRGIPGKIAGALGNLGNLLVPNGRSLMDGLLTGIRQAAQNVYDFVSGIAGKIASLKGPIPYDLKLLIPNGKAIMKSLETGLEKGFVPVMANVKGIAGEIADGLSVKGLSNRVASSVTAAVGLKVNPAMLATAGAAAAGPQTIVNEGDTFTFNQPIKSPAQVAREIRRTRTYGLAGSRGR